MAAWGPLLEEGKGLASDDIIHIVAKNSEKFCFNSDRG